MDNLIIWKSLIVFWFVFYFFWIVFYTFHPRFLQRDDFINPNTGSRGYDGSDAVLSDRGRTTLFVFSLIPAGSFTFAYILYSLVYVRTIKIECGKKTKKLGLCKIVKSN
jgi:hypothetical protein